LVLIKEHKVVDFQLNTRLINYCNNNFIDVIHSKKAIKKAILTGAIKLNNNKVETGRYIKDGDVIQLYDLENKPPKTYNLNLDIIFEDEFLAVVKKPAGLVVSGNQFRTVVNALPFNIKVSTEKDALRWAKPVHRLDNQTSGLLIVSKTKLAHINLGKQFENKLIKKKYIALVIGKLVGNGFITEPIENKLAKTEYRVIKSVKSLKNKHLTLVELFPYTGRTHQLRIHLSNMGFPILGDKLYGKEDLILKHKGLFLSAVELLFKHPVKGNDLEIKVDMPNKFNTRLMNEQRRFLEYTQTT